MALLDLCQIFARSCYLKKVKGIPVGIGNVLKKTQASQADVFHWTLDVKLSCWLYCMLQEKNTGTIVYMSRMDFWLQPTVAQST